MTGNKSEELSQDVSYIYYEAPVAESLEHAYAVQDENKNNCSHRGLTDYINFGKRAVKKAVVPYSCIEQS